ncbi:polysaccharide ABC transporter ATP-binding protein [Butyrivibrio fibrisolvens]|uniref:ABC transporter ATP-binding protein n=1 Tax=Butyrivibrio fibrisolvens TaxID=831 RepID=UPI0003B707A5|nr:polysaccharide ABC transporter ATP-binding protein [Butyrivibrio fibrisolvens]
MNDVIIRIEGLKKQYRLGTIGGGTLSADLQSWWARKRGKEDPNVKIGANTSRYGDVFNALDGIDLEIKKGEAVGIIGTNGAGKSTLLKLISRVTAPSEGRILMDGTVASMLEVGTGFHAELTGRENIYMNGAILGMTKEEIDSKIDDIIDFSECRQFIDTPVKRYSSGMYVKLAFSVAAHLDADIMIMDEVLAVGDISFQKKCLDKMRNLASDSKRTVLYVSHNMDTIRRLCDRCIVLSKGKLIYDGDVEEAINIYSNNVLELTSVNKYGLSREDDDINKDVMMDSLEVINCENNTIYYGTEFKFRLKWHVNNIPSNIRMRFIITDESGNPVATANSGDFLKLNGEGIFCVNTSALAPGKYCVEIILLELIGVGIQKRLDCVKKAVSFRIIQKNGDFNGFEWNRWWGKVVLDDISIT